MCAISEIPLFVVESGRLAVWDQLPEEVRRRLASLTPEVLAALHALFNGEPRRT